MTREFYYEMLNVKHSEHVRRRHVVPTRTGRASVRLSRKQTLHDHRRFVAYRNQLNTTTFQPAVIALRAFCLRIFKNIFFVCQYMRNSSCRAGDYRSETKSDGIRSSSRQTRDFRLSKSFTKTCESTI